MNNISSKKTDFRIKRLIISLIILYFVMIAVLGSLFIYLDYRQARRLARSYAAASRSSFLIRDVRQAMASLTPALADGFDAVDVFDSNGQLIFGLPNSSASSSLRSPFEFNIVVIISSGDNGSSEMDRVRFFYPFLRQIEGFFFASLALLLAYYVVFNKLKASLKRQHHLIINRERLEAEQRIAVQVAHDIRAPIFALNVTISRLDVMDEQGRVLLINAAKRINDIADDLLNGNRLGKDGAVEAVNLIGRCLKPENIRIIVQNIYNEKLSSLIGRSEISLKLDFGSVKDPVANIEAAKLSRVISNLLDNAIESIKDEGCVTVGIRVTKSEVSIIVMDNGVGIEESVLARLGTERFSFRKASGKKGNGLGLIHAKASISEMNGQFHIQSKVGVGSIASIKLPLVFS